MAGLLRARGRHTIAYAGRALALALLALLVPGAAFAAAPAQTAPYRWCDLSLRDQDPPGRTPAYNLTLVRRGTSCATAVRVMKAFHRCRTSARLRCTRPVLRRWRCDGRGAMRGSTRVASFTCTSGRRRVRGGYWQDRPGCFGAAARDPRLRCYSRARTMFPAPGRSDPDRGWMCDTAVILGACVFGTAPGRSRGHFAIIGDSHVIHWRPALRTLAAAARWTGYSFSRAGCFFSEAVGRFYEDCVRWVRDFQAWIASHPEVDTVFVTSNADTWVATQPGESTLEVKVDGFARAWQALPATVTRLIVLRDTPRSTASTLACIERAARAARRSLAAACPLARSAALRDDAAVQTVRRLGSPRYRSIDLSNFMCSRANCYPVVGGVRVNADDEGHLNATFMRTLGPYLLREVRALFAAGVRR